MTREVLRRPVFSHIVAQDGVDVFERGDVGLVGPACYQQRLLPIFDGTRERGEVGEHGRGIVRGPPLLVACISPTHPAGGKPVASLKPGDHAADALAGHPVGVEAVAREVETGVEFGGDLLELGSSGRVEVGEPFI